MPREAGIAHEWNRRKLTNVGVWGPFGVEWQLDRERPAIAVCSSGTPSRRRASSRLRRGGEVIDPRVALPGRSWRVMAAAVLILIAPGEASGQARAVLIGRVVSDSNESPVRGAEVVLEEGRVTTTTNAAGVFRLSGLPAGRHRVVVRHIGFEPAGTDLLLSDRDTVAIVVRLRASSVVLDSLVVTAEGRPLRPDLQALEVRKRMGLGKIFNAEDLAAFEGRTILDVIRRYAVIDGGGVSSRRGTTSFQQRHCPMQVILDGLPVTRFDFRVDIRLEDLGGLEIYLGGASTPVIFERGTNAMCGVIVLWTRDR